MMRLLLGALGALLLVACGPIYETQYDFLPPTSAEGRLCTSQCNNISDLCRQNCDLKDDRCIAEARERGAYEYERYVRDRQSQKLPIEKKLEDFTYTGGCYQASSCKAECDTSYRQCFTGCGGTVNSRTVCTAFCN